ncbi:heterokaryon incompatibility protein [Colletotrichum truncatum]|uniref:Heterokaryon incompatibility protein n=1 Tax=Colletotrichum truncatum TaxID=5467 RepID=A0ACC3YI04_COLTU|nr:heterokaryon incompatibility protein [Colletotrichum truncatum]KAF6786050.1 heterokaryon incompatibility protein [Colletotrichum truncatum]
MEYTAQNAPHYGDDLPATAWYRLLTLEPSDQPTNPLICHLQAQEMSRAGSYEALSYVWGDVKTQKTILINDKPFIIREGLYNALIALRSDFEPKRLWVDAICINQGSVHERNCQVRQMNKIYAGAKRVNVWLGRSSAATDRGIEFLKSFENISTDGWGVHDSESAKVETYWSLFGPFIEGLRQGVLSPNLHDALQLLEKPWWRRMWTLQESVLCRYVTCWCGQKSLPLSCFWNFAWFIYLSLNYGHWSGHPIDASIPWKTAIWVGRLGRMVAKDGKIPLLVALEASWNRAASDPRDKIIGLLGLVDQSSGLALEYGWAVEKVYRKGFAAVLRETKNLSPLGLLSEFSFKRNPMLPSWVPDFEIHSTSGSNDLASLSKSIWSKGNFIMKNSLITGEDHRVITTEEDDSILVVEGISIDVVLEIGKTAPGWNPLDPAHGFVGNPWKEKMREVLMEWRKMIPLSDKNYSTGEPQVDAFWRTVLTDLQQGGALGAQRLKAQDLELLSELESHEGMENLLLTWEDPKKPDARQLRLLEQQNRRFFITSKGYFGLGHPSLQPGDTVCTLKGGDVIYGLRATENGRWIYVGEGYLHGVMDGEITKAATLGEYSYQTFRIE